MKVRAAVLAESLASLVKARPWSPGVIQKLETLVKTADDYDLFRINPLRFAADRLIPEQEAIDVLLHGTKAGLFQMEWNLVCPTCGDMVESFRTLSRLNSHFHCTVCNLNSEASLDDYIHVTFTISPEVREITFHHPESLSISDFHLRYHFNQSAMLPDGARFLDVVPSLVKGQAFLAPFARQRFEVETTGGTLTFNDLIHHESAAVLVDGHPAPARQQAEVIVEGSAISTDPVTVGKGKVVFTVRNRTSSKASMLIINFPPDFVKKRLRFEPYLSGKRLLSTQTFRELFSSEVIKGTEGIGVRDITILFTDLKGSTALYDRIGDLPAFSLVHQHFDRLGQAIRQNNGAFIKTIGDAVMACFLNPGDAVKAALTMIRDISRFNKSATNGQVILKVGIHKGPCIAVTLNDRLDYFGQTVNIASRVQGLAGAEEIYVTQSVFGFEGVRTLLRGHKVFTGKARLKGIAEEMQVYRICPPAARPPVPAPGARPGGPPLGPGPSATRSPAR
ncbi:MAG TPA: DUF5939 domain-containing protein [Spirochaetia bacterium]|nr:DUF5939 domain-containing protein [Spirochaetia bacterium]